MSKNVTTYDCEQGTILKSYSTFVAFKSKDGKHFVTRKNHSKTTSRHINEFFGGKEIVENIDKVFQTDLDVIGKFLETYHNG